MKYTMSSNGLPGTNPIANLFVIVIGVLVIAATIVLGFFAFIIIGSAILVLAAVVGVRVWWFKRQLRGKVAEGTKHSARSSKGIIEGEYQVVADEDEGE